MIFKNHPSEKPQLHKEILLAEDDEADISILMDLFKERPWKIEVSVVKNGLDLVNELTSRKKDSSKTFPSLIILDLNMPKKNGKQALAEIKKDPELSSIPVIVLTSSDDSKDIDTCYQLHVNSYIKKADDFYGIEEIVKTIEKFWFETACLPSFKS